ncbi:hypothetical protein U9M48_039156 [Paspalum notatum var. saurae]|uniref:Uncharacterized protein n=1 Tax=Paspalum notatum var. saurae TaxID=547442 RepID=A0AAQ3UJ25_PASNO
MEALAACSSNAALAQESGAPVLATVFFRLDQSPKGAQERLQGFFAFAMASGPLQAAADPGTREVESARGAAVGSHQSGDARGGGRARRRRGQPLARDARAGGRVGRRRSRRPILVQPADTGKPPKAVSLSAASHPKLPLLLLLGPPLGTRSATAGVGTRRERRQVDGGPAEEAMGGAAWAWRSERRKRRCHGIRG